MSRVTAIWAGRLLPACHRIRYAAVRQISVTVESRNGAALMIRSRPGSRPNLSGVFGVDLRQLGS